MESFTRLAAKNRSTLIGCTPLVGKRTVVRDLETHFIKKENSDEDLYDEHTWALLGAVVPAGGGVDN